MTLEEKKFILDVHNSYRSHVAQGRVYPYPSAGDMREMVCATPETFLPTDSPSYFPPGLGPGAGADGEALGRAVLGRRGRLQGPR